MATSTPLLLLRKPDVTDLVDVLADINANWDRIEAALAFYRAAATGDRIKEVRVNGLEARTNVAYGALATAMAVTVTPGPSGILEVTVGCVCGSNGAAGSALMSFACSVNNVRAVNDDVAFGIALAGANTTVHGSRTSILTGQTPNPTTVTALFRSGGADTASYLHRQLIVKAL